MTDITFRLVTDDEVSAYLRDMVKGGAFAVFRIDRVGDSRRVQIRMNASDFGNEVRRLATSTLLHSRFASQGATDIQFVVGFSPLWTRLKGFGG